MNDWWQKKYNENNNFNEIFKKWEVGRNKLNIYKIINENLNCKNILNVGCGTGYDFKEFNNYFTKNKLTWEGVEYSDFMVDEGKKNNIPIKKGNIYELDLVINKQYNCVLAIDVFEHLDNLELALNNMINFSNKYVIISFFKIPIENNKEIVVNKHINDKDVKIKECMNGKKFIKENPGFRNGYCKNCFYNTHNKNYIEDFLIKNNLEFEWKKYDDNDNTILLIIEK